MDGIGSLPTFALLIWAGALILLGGLAATVDAALGVISLARATALARGRVNGEVGGRRAEQPVPWGAAALEKVAADRARYRSLLVMLRVACEVTATVLVALVAVTALGMGAAAVLVAVAVMTTVGFVVVGAVPRLLGPRHAYLVGRLAAPALRWLGRLLRPLTWLLGLVGRALTAGRVQRDAPFATPDNGEPDLTVELRELVDLAEERGGVERGEREMIDSVFRLGDTVAREVMVPRTEMVWIEAHKSLRQGLGAGAGDVLGVVYRKDLARRTVGGDPTLADSVRVDQVMRKALFVPVSKPVDDLLSEMRAARVHMAIVVDEYGGTAGLVTI